MEKSLKLNWFFFAGKNILYKNIQPRVFSCLRLYDLQTYVRQSASYVTVKDQFQVKVKSPAFQDKSLISYAHLRNISDFRMTSDSSTNCITMETIEQEIADDYLDNLILNTINTTRKNRKRPDTSSIHEYLPKS